MKGEGVRDQRILFVPRKGDEKRCADLLIETLSTYKGVVSAEVDQQTSTLTLRYDPQLISLERVDRLASRLGMKLDKRFERCTLHLEGTSCRDCSLAVERDLRRLDEVTWVTVNPAAAEISVEYEAAGGATLSKIEKRIHALGYEVKTGKGEGWRRNWMATLTVLCGVFLISAWLMGRFTTASTLQLVLYLLAYMTGGYYGALESFRALRSLTLDINVLMVVAALGAAAVGRWGEGAILLFLFSLSTTLESYAIGRTRQAIRVLMDLSPQEASVKRDGREVKLPVEQLEVGDIVLVKPGERISADGIVVRGASTVDQSPITGESLPVDKEESDGVYAGTINGQGALKVQVTKRADDTTLAKVIRMVEEAQSHKAPTQRLIDRFSQPYALTVIGATLLAILIPYLFSDQELRDAFYRAMILLVVASPCALVISTPASILSAIANAARQGILFKGGVHLENVGDVRVVVFDKTGTLTTGRLQVTDVIPMSGLPEDELLQLAASVERLSEHPVAEAIAATARARELMCSDASNLRTIRGQGVQANVDGQEIWIGNTKLFTERGRTLPHPVIEKMRELESQGKTSIVISDEKPLGIIAVADTIRPAARQISGMLRKVGVSKTVMLTGDHERVAGAIAAQLGIDEYRAGLLPEDKVEAINGLLERYGKVIMIGDGVNDAPALTTATVGMAMGVAGTDVALETADVVLMADDLLKLPYAIDLSRRTRRVIQQNLAFSGLVILALILTALLGLTTLPLGVVGHEGSTLLVVVNGLRLLRPVRYR
ncbi:MAG: heavy metal translocating P-type ATPase [Candidatus Bipolaricaulia bacterium]